SYGDWSSDVCSSDLENNDFRYAQRIAEKVPAKRVPEAIRRIIDHYKEYRQDGERFADFVVRVTPKSLGPLVADLRPVDKFSFDKIGRASCRERGWVV